MPDVVTDIEKLYPAHVERYRKLYEDVLSSCNSDGMEGFVISSGTVKTAFLDDHPYPFKTNPHFKSWLPVIDNDQSFLVIKPGQRPLLLFHQPRDYWHQSPDDPQGFWVDQFEIRTVAMLDDALTAMGNTASLIFIGEENDLAQAWGFGQINPEHILNAVHYERAYKTDYEIACLQLANDQAVRGHRAAESAFRTHQSEFDIQHAYLGTIRHREHQTPYSSIVALNEHCAVLHYQHYDLSPPPEIHSMLIDAGANYNGYAADVTRTYAFKDDEFQALIDSLDEQQRALVGDISIGVSYVELHRQMHLRLANLLREFRFVDMTPESMVELGLTFTFLPHGLGHFLGLQTHDVGGHQATPGGHQQPPPEAWPALRLTRPIEDRQVFTIEPGLYFIPMLLNELKQSEHASSVNWPRVEEFIPYGGIRIEDNVAIIDESPFNLTRHAFETLGP
ncbi:MAG: Xaa-Pro dipeptidase [Pseudomonadales bacterium]